MIHHQESSNDQHSIESAEAELTPEEKRRRIAYQRAATLGTDSNAEARELLRKKSWMKNKMVWALHRRLKARSAKEKSTTLQMGDGSFSRTPTKELLENGKLIPVDGDLFREISHFSLGVWRLCAGDRFNPTTELDFYGLRYGAETLKKYIINQVVGMKKQIPQTMQDKPVAVQVFGCSFLLCANDEGSATLMHLEEA